MAQANCVGAYEIMFAHQCTPGCLRALKDDNGCNSRDERVRKARHACFRCPVRRECLTWSLLTSANYGICGGFTESERAEMRRILRGKKFVIRRKTRVNLTKYIPKEND